MIEIENSDENEAMPSDPNVDERLDIQYNNENGITQDNWIIDKSTDLSMLLENTA